MAKTLSLSKLIEELGILVSEVESDQLRADIESNIIDIQRCMSDLGDVKKMVDKSLDILQDLTY